MIKSRARQIEEGEIIQNIKIKKMYVESIVMHYEQGEILDNDGSYKNYIQVQNQINVVDKDLKNNIG